ncbi:sigma-70 family RNA polymerase sigma factor [Paenibacillus sp. FSL W7-1287]|uniref:sigma-70 family RNA polymerase sigma factor n=1 Tax=Paenibacillus sp. FSL W7-1287 TaxID=2954538 RepID=UPI0030FB7187
MKEHSVFLMFQQLHPTLFEDRAISKFFENPNHIILFVEAVMHPSEEKMQDFKHRLSSFLFSLRFTSYMVSLIRYAAIDHHRKRRRYMDRCLLIYDSPAGDEENGNSVGDFLLEKQSQYTTSTAAEDELMAFESTIEDEQLHEQFIKLTDRQKHVVTLYYAGSFKDAEIAALLDVTQQAVSKTRRAAINKMRKNMMPNRTEVC